MSTTWHGCLVNTRYSEMRSSSGHDHGVWITTPPAYDATATRTPSALGGPHSGEFACPSMTCGLGNVDDHLTGTKICEPTCRSRRSRWRPGEITGTDR
jgi:hypothetical protein